VNYSALKEAEDEVAIMRKITGHPNVMNLMDYKVDGKLKVPDVKEL